MRYVRDAVAVLLLVACLVAFCATEPAAGSPSDAARTALDKAAREYGDALDRLAATRKELASAQAARAAADRRIAVLQPRLTELARRSYKNGRIRGAALLLEPSDRQDLLDRASLLYAAGRQDARTLAEVTEARHVADRAALLLSARATAELAATRRLAERKKAAEVALARVAGPATPGWTSAIAPKAKPGANLSGGCTVNDPTTSGCITPRTANMLAEAKKAGFTWYVSCYRSGGSGEHPKGRACDFASNKKGFAGVATGANRTYGNNLAAWAVANASRLGIYYVIWYKQIWFIGQGWRSYSLATGQPNTDHTNHVHISMK